MNKRQKIAGTQAQCKAQYRALLENAISEITRIDRATPGSTVEPDWWCQMMELERKLRENLKSL